VSLGCFWWGKKWFFLFFVVVFYRHDLFLNSPHYSVDLCSILLLLLAETCINNNDTRKSKDSFKIKGNQNEEGEWQSCRIT
jgi:hypothetical protein